MLHSRIRPAALAAALLASGAAAHADTTLLTEGFEFVDQLASHGWLLTNGSTPGGDIQAAWFQGSSTIFSAQAGDAASFAASNYATAPAGGTISNWISTPFFSTEMPVVVTFYARADLADGYSDQLAWGFATQMSAPVTVGGEWTKYSAYLPAQGAGTSARFAIQYTGLADASNYVGIDSLTVTAVPEPGAWLLMGAGLIGLAAVRTRRR